MIDEIQFSERGELLTEFEMRLVQQSKSEYPWCCLARRLVVDLGMSAGCRALAAVLDELGGEKPHVPTRKGFFDRLWREERDALIVQLFGRPDWTQADIARAMGVSSVYVHHLVRGKPQRTTKRGRHGRHVAHD